MNKAVITGESSNFTFLKQQDELLYSLARGAEKIFSADPNACLMKLRQLGEAMAQNMAANLGVEFDQKTTQAELLSKLNREISFDPAIRQLFHVLRIEGNKANHQFKTRHKEAMDALKVARGLSVWFYKTFGSPEAGFSAGAFIPPEDPSEKLYSLNKEIEQLKAELSGKNEQINTSADLKALIEQEKAEYEQLAIAMDEESRKLAQENQQLQTELESLSQNYEAKLADMAQKLAQLSQKDAQQQKSAISTKAKAATKAITLNESLTRILIDQQLQDAGWEVDTDNLTFKSGARPEKGKNKAIAEWPTFSNDKNGRADYVLFAGLIPVGVVEAKRENVNVAGKIKQAERYSRGFTAQDNMTPAWAEQGRTIAWPDEQAGHFHVPFVYSCNGRPFVKQLEEQSGTWFRDVRDPSYAAHAMQGFHSPAGLLDRLKRDKEAAQAKLAKEPFGYLKVRDYQRKAIEAVESSLERGQKSCLLAMATGTGKTRTIIGLMYRFLKAERFNRILFLVDRRSLGTQALESFEEAQLEQNQSLSKIYNIAELGDMSAEAETRVQVATVQAMVRRLFQSDNAAPIDQFDCIIVDEAHRGYTLDQEMTEGELATRDAAQYLSSYRRVLDYFDAVKIGLTATPAKHTSDIFGKPVYTYSYREAVADDWLIDHEPPIRYETLLTQKGIHFAAGDEVASINLQTGEVQSDTLEDELDFEVDAFNRKVINENFNRVICEQLVTELDPFGDEKTMIFCATDLHADMVKRLLDNAFKDIYGEDYREAAVAKITGQSDKVDLLIKHYKNERYPNIAITVDLLTTGIDVPKICNLVFLRRIRSRILYEQMIGRATRRCDDIGKTVFRIYDPVDIYAALQDVSTMKPLVKDPNITLDDLVGELSDQDWLEHALDTPGDVPDSSQADVVLSQLGQKLMRTLRKAEARAESKPELKQKLNELKDLWGVEPKELHQHLHELGPKQASQFLQQHSNLLGQISEVKQLLGSEYKPIISEHDDEIRERTQSWGDYTKPEDYLLSFKAFIELEINNSAALSAVINRPKDLTREQLREIKLLLDGAGYSEAKLQSAVRNQTNQDIAASIIGHIRQAAIGEALLPFETRVDNAMNAIYASHAWNPMQVKWLQRLAKQLVHEVVIDRDFVNHVASGKGGAKQVDKILSGELDSVLSQLKASLWAS